MDENMKHQPISAPFGGIEPHAPLLSIPPEGQLLYKIMTVENLLRSIIGSYLHFNRVDSYSDSPIADPNDGRQLPKDEPGNASVRFKNAPDFSAANYYDQSRARTYACCFSVENSDFIWENYANGSEKGKVCVVFEFGRLRATLNRTLQPGSAALLYNGNHCHQIFSINYGLVDYVKWDAHQMNADYLANPTHYTYLKDEARFSGEKELRISLSTVGIGQFALNDGTTIEFPSSLQLALDFRDAIANNVIREILLAPDSDSGFLKSELSKFRRSGRAERKPTQ